MSTIPTESTSPRTLSAHCHCRASTLSFSAPLPLPVHFCHCSICRYTHGALVSVHAPIPTPDVDLSSFTPYKSSQHVSKYFCKTCGSHMLDRVDAGDDEEKWYVAAALVETGAEEGVWAFGSHNFVASTVDGGMAVYLKRIAGVEMECWDGRPAEHGEWKGAKSEKEIDEIREDGEVKVKCHCGGIDLLISRPDGTAAAEYLPENLRPRDPSKWLGRHCVCDDCRGSTSSPVASWVTIPTAAIAGLANLKDGFSGAATTFKRSPAVTRTFCAGCGACVSAVRGDEPGVVQIAAGLLRGTRATRARAENWVEWSKSVNGCEDVGLKDVVASFREGLSG